MINVKTHENDLVEMLIERLSQWTDDAKTLELFRRYYEDCVYGGVFEGTTLNINEIVDNDYVNNFSVYDDKEIKDNDVPKDCIVAEYNGLYLVQW